MSVTTDGRIRITPALNATEINKFNKALKAEVKAHYKTLGFAKTFEAITDPAEVRNELGVGLEITETTRETEEGTLHIRRSESLSFAYTDSEPRLGFVNVVELLKKTFPKHILEGELVQVHEECTSATKVVAAEGKVSTVFGTTQVVWDDNSAPTELRKLV